jgi:hypothetical protein
MENRTITVYRFRELSPEAQKVVMKRYREFAEQDDMPFLADTVREAAEIFFDRSKVEIIGRPELRYSLGYSKGDGVSFVGTFKIKHGKKWYEVTTKARNCRDVHEKSVTFSVTDENGYEPKEAVALRVEEKFKRIFEDACRTGERAGYAEIEYRKSDEAVLEDIEANSNGFLADGRAAP